MECEQQGMQTWDANSVMLVSKHVLIVETDLFTEVLNYVYCIYIIWYMSIAIKHDNFCAATVVPVKMDSTMLLFR